METAMNDLINTTLKSMFYNIKDISVLFKVITVDMGNSKINYSFLEHNYVEFCNKTKIDTIKNVLDTLDDHYYNSNQSLVSDKVYDYICDYYYNKTKQPKMKIGAPVQSGKIRLPVHMGSMDKVKPGSNELTKFLAKYKGPKCISEKLDGISLLIDFNGEYPIAYTRGDGTYGQNVSNILEYINIGNIPCDIGGYVRGELIISKDNWNTMKHKGANARNYVSGIVNKKNQSAVDFEGVSFIAYEYISCEHLNIQKQLELLEEFSFNVVKHIVYSKELNGDKLKEILVEFRDASQYEIDGIIVQDNKFYPRNTSGNPAYAKAFKCEEHCEQAETYVVNVEWTASKDGRMKPVVVVDPVSLNGVTISRATGYNARFITENGIGPGAKVVIIRSGDVIPKIVGVIEQVEPLMPECSYEWDTNHTDILLDNSGDNRDVKIRQIEHFVNTTGIEGFKIGTITKGYDVGITSVEKLISVTKYDLLKIEGVKERTASKVYSSIQQHLDGIPIAVLAAASPYFNGLGLKRIQSIVDNIPDFMEINSVNLANRILAISGFSDKLASVFMEGLDSFKGFVEKYKSKYTIGSGASSSVQVVSDKLKGKQFVFSGFRSEELEKKIHEMGGEVKDSITKSTNYLVVKSKDKITGKMDKAMKMGIEIITGDDVNMM